MSKAKITFHQCNQNSQEYGSDDEHMGSRVFFTLEIGEDKFEKLHADLKQTVGADYENGPIEVGPPQDYDGPFNHEAFRAFAEKYYRSCVGSEGTGIRIKKGSKNISMENIVHVKEMICEFEISGGS